MDKNHIVPRTDEEKEVLWQHDIRYGAKAYCKNCKHAFKRTVNLKDSIYLCHALPPDAAAQALLDPQMNITNVQVSTHFIPRAVPADYFCSLFAIAPTDIDV